MLAIKYCSPRLAPLVDDLWLHLVHEMIDVPHRHDRDYGSQTNHNILDDGVLGT